MGEPATVSLCHCLACQKRTGSAFGVAVFFDRDAVTPDGPSATYRRLGDSGLPVDFHFCPDCGTSVWWEPARVPALIGVALGAFADPTFPAPSQSVYEATKHPWVEPSLAGMSRR